MQFIQGQDWRDKIEALRRLATNVRARHAARRFTPEPLTEAQRESVEQVTRFEMLRGRILKQNGAQPRVTNRRGVY